METYYEKNKEKIRQAQKEYYQQTKEQRLLKQKEWYQNNKDKAKQDTSNRRKANPDKWIEYRERFNTNHPLIHLLGNCRRRAKQSNIPCTITLQDLESLPIPDHCLVLGIKIDNTLRESTLSLDKIIPSLGYVPGNIMFMSVRANRLKSDASLMELQQIVEFLTQLGT